MRRLLGIIVLASIASLFLWLQANRGPRYQIDPSLPAKVEAALMRLKSCSPKTYAFIAEQPIRFIRISGNMSSSTEDTVGIAADFLQDNYSPEADEYILMLTAAHETRHTWQYKRPNEFTDYFSHERDAYSFAAQVFRDCPTTDSYYVNQVRVLFEEWSINPSGNLPKGVPTPDLGNRN